MPGTTPPIGRRCLGVRERNEKKNYKKKSVPGTTPPIGRRCLVVRERGRSFFALKTVVKTVVSKDSSKDSSKEDAALPFVKGVVHFLP